MNTRRSTLPSASEESPLIQAEAVPPSLSPSSTAVSTVPPSVLDPTASLLADIAEAKATWVSSLQHLNSLLKSAAPDEQSVAQLKSAIANSATIISESERFLSIMNSNSAVVTPPSVPQASMPAHPISFPPNLPALKAGSTRNVPFDVYEFIDVFEGILRGALVPEQFWTAALITSVPSTDFETISFLNKNVCPLPWPDARLLVLKHFSSVDLIRHYNQQFSSIRCASDESVSRFAARFLNLVSKAKKDPDCATTRDVFLAALPSSLQCQLKIKAVELDSLSELISFAIRFESLEEALVFHSERNKPAKPLQPSDDLFCNYCRKPGHIIVNCPKKALKASSSQFSAASESSGAPKVSSPQSSPSVICFKCHAPGHISPNCPLNQPSASQPAQANKTNTVSAYSSCTVNSLSADPRTFVQILLNGQSFDALVDPGSALSFISKDVYDALFSQPPLSTSIQCSGFFAQPPRSPIGISPLIHVEIGNFSMDAEFLVEFLASDICVILGVDLLSPCGICIANLPVATPEVSGEVDLDPLENVSADVLQQPLDATQQEQICSAVTSLLDENSRTADLFCSHPHALVSLPSGSSPASYVKQYRIPFHLRPVVAETVQSWLQKGIIVEAPVGCSWNSPLLVVSKKDLEGKPTKHRVCLDPRPINDLLPDDRFPIPLIEEMLERTAGSSIFSSIDLVNSYHQFPLVASDCQKTSFSALGRQFMFVGAPFGIKTLTSTFQRVMHSLFVDKPFVMVYVDDLLIHSSSLELHIEHVAEVIRILSSVNLTINRDKSKFGFSKLVYLGHMISAEGVYPDPLKLETIRDWPLPRTGTEVRSFLGLANYLRDYIPRYADLCASLESLKVLSSISCFSEEQFLAFNNIKTSLLNSSILSYPDFSKPFFLATDASNVGVGAVLYQDTESNALKFKSLTRKFIGFFSKSSSPTERRYSANKKELLAVVKALHHFRYYLFGNPFVLVTDHASLKYMNEQKYLSPALANWSDIIFSYTFKVVHCPGKTNFLPDLFSRINRSSSSGDSSLVSSLPVSLVPVCAASLASSHSADSSDLLLPSEEFSALSSAEEPSLPDSDALPVPDRETRHEILQNLHSFGHFGAGYLQTLANDQGISWPSLKHDALSVTSNCHECQLFNQHVPAYAPLSSLLAQKPFAHVVIDLIGPLPLSANGNSFILILVDVCTRFVLLEPLPNKSAFCVASALFKNFTRFGFPQVIQSDNGTEFVNALVVDFCALFNMKHRLSLPYHPRCNGIVEREVKTTIQILCKQLQGFRDSWCKRLPAVEFSLNAKTHANFNFSPFALMFMRVPLVPVLDSAAEFDASSFSLPDAVNRFLSFRTRLDEHFEAQVCRASRSAERFSKHKRIVDPAKFSPGDRVYKLNYDKRSKLDPVKSGPFIVERVHSGRSLVLKDPSGAVLPKKVPISHVSKSSYADSSSSDTSPVFFVERIVNHREYEGEFYYFVKWLGYDSSSNTWEPAHSFTDPAMIQAYWDALELRGGSVNSHSTSVL